MSKKSWHDPDYPTQLTGGKDGPRGFFRPDDINGLFGPGGIPQKLFLPDEDRFVLPDNERFVLPDNERHVLPDNERFLLPDNERFVLPDEGRSARSDEVVHRKVEAPVRDERGSVDALHPEKMLPALTSG